MVLLDGQPAEAFEGLPSYPTFYRLFHRIFALLPALAPLGVGRVAVHPYVAGALAFLLMRAKADVVGVMKAIVRETYGPPDVLHLAEVPTPALRDGDVLVKVRAASANAGDWHLLRGTPLPFRLVAGLRTPKFKIIGTDIAGTVDAVGRSVTRFRPGDEVFGELSRSGFGAYAEFATAPEHALALKPVNLSFEEAATLPTAGCTALQGLRKGRIQQGQRVLINGASGGVGTFAVQIAKAFGTEVTAVCSTRNADIVRAIGADHVIDYTKEDFATRGQRYDLILATNGDRSIWDYKRALTARGSYAMTGGSNRQLTDALL